MSNVAITGNASGTGVFTVASPNSNVDRVLTLPDESGTVIVDESNSGAIKVTSAGNVGIGTSSPNSTLNVVGPQTTFDTNVFGQVLVRSTAAYNATPRAGIAFSVKYNSAGNYIAGGSSIQGYKQTAVDGEFANGLLFTTQAEGSSPAERMRLDSSGNLMVGTTSYAGVGCTFDPSGRLYVNRTNNDAVAEWYRSSVRVGSVSVTTTATAYNTSSDYRLKEDWQPMTGASERVKALKPVNFAWKADGSRVDGFLAHEAQEVVPECVTGAKDAVDAEGKPNYQGIDQSKLVPLVTAALQEALAKIDALTARIEALETAP